MANTTAPGQTQEQELKDKREALMWHRRRMAELGLRTYPVSQLIEVEVEG